MHKITIGRNDAGQRLDRFLRKYLNGASLSYVYKLIRRDVKINGKRGKNELILEEGDELVLYLPDDRVARLRRPVSAGADAGRRHAGRHFQIAMEDENVLAVVKPFGLLTHGDQREKKRTLVNEVVDYLIEKQEYIPRLEPNFTPAPANRLDRNTSGLVLFGKNAAALRALNAAIRSRSGISKYYYTIMAGEPEGERVLQGVWSRNGQRSRIRLIREEDGVIPSRQAGEPGEKYVETVIRPIRSNGGFTFAEIELVTGRTHQIRAHLAESGFPIVGDGKYGNPVMNRRFREQYGLSAQLLHAGRLVFHEIPDPLSGLGGKQVEAALPERFQKVMHGLKLDS